MKINAITIAITMVSALSIFGAVSYNGKLLAEQQVEDRMIQAELANESNAVLSRPQVEVVRVLSDAYNAEITGYGEAQSQFELTFTAEVTGRIESLNSGFESGQVVQKGTILATMDSIQYEQVLAEANSNLAQAKLDLLEEEREGVQAKLEWQKSGIQGDPASPLVLREPQLLKAKMALKNAEKAQKKAQQDLDKTEIKAPFDALIVNRNVSPGSYVQTGAEIATLYSVDQMEIEIPLSESQWKNIQFLDNQSLNESAIKPQVSLLSSDELSHWQGYVSRVEQHLDMTTRQRSLIVSVEKPLEQNVDLYPGTFVKATIQGGEVNALWKLPASSISQQGKVWVIGEGGKLQSYNADVRFEKGDYVYISAIDLNDASTLVVKRPLSSYKVNMLVTANIEG